MTGPTNLSRRNACGLLAGLIATAYARPATAQASRFDPETPFSWASLVQQAKALASRRYQDPPIARTVAADFDAAGRLTYGDAERLADRIRLFPATNIAPHPVGIHIVQNGRARRVRDMAGLFASGGLAEPAGFRILSQSLKSDWLAFLGASYFRASGSTGQYGLSARAIAVDTGLQRPEEFPRFTDFWIEAVAEGRFRIHALLDGPSLAGAFSFDCRVDATGVHQDVHSVLFIRQNIERLGIAPATSMFWYDEGQRNLATDWRPEIHDSDGLAIVSGNGERIWRPLANPAHARVNSFAMKDLKGFGLLQRDQRFENYQDDGAFYDRRPNLWMEPVGAWGPGSVLLYQMPTNSETADNIVAFWVGDRPARAGEQREFRYTLHWTSDDRSDGGVARAVNRWTGTAGTAGAPPIQGARKYVIDFAGDGLAGLDRQSGVEAMVNLAPPALMSLSVYPIVGQKNHWRVVLDVRLDQAQGKELRLYLRRGSSALSETVIESIAP